MGLKEYVSRLFRRKEQEPNPDGLSMIELTVRYLPLLASGSYTHPEQTAQQLEVFGMFVATLTDEQMYDHLTRIYGLPDSKAQAFVEDSRSYREDMRRLRELVESQ